MIDLLIQKAERGFSPSSLGNYIRNPLAFYKENLLGIRDGATVEEAIAANTFGTIVHDSLEHLYLPLQNTVLTPSALKNIKSRIRKTVSEQFSKSYADKAVLKGNNHISYEVIVRYIERFIDLEIKECQKHEVILLGLELELDIPLALPNVPHKLRLKGKLDRVDSVDGQLRIIDYKTGMVEQKHLEVIDWETLWKEEKYSKAFQLLCYALMYDRLNDNTELTAAIFSFRNVSSGMLYFATKDSQYSKIKERGITTTVLGDFQSALSQLIQEIFNPDIPFAEKPS